MRWPPTPGRYRAVILRDSIRSNWEVIDVSPVFTVAAPTDINEESLSLVRSDFETLITKNITLAAKFLRLAFHDCTGGCDGCVSSGLLFSFQSLTRSGLSSSLPLIS